MDPSLLELGVGGAFVILVLGKIFEFLIPLLRGERKDDPLKKIEETAVCIDRRVADLHAWHNVKNHDGIPVWYVPSALEKAILELAKNTEAQTEVLRSLVTIVGETHQIAERVERKTNG